MPAGCARFSPVRQWPVTDLIGAPLTDMPIVPGTRVGLHAIVSPLGAGGLRRAGRHEESDRVLAAMGPMRPMFGLYDLRVGAIDAAAVV